MCDVEMIRGLVQQEFGGFLRKCACDLRTLPFATGQGVPPAVGLVGQPRPRQRLIDDDLASSPPNIEPCGVRPSRTTSRTQMSTSVLACWETTATRRATCLRRSPARSASSNNT